MLQILVTSDEVVMETRNSFIAAGADINVKLPVGGVEMNTVIATGCANSGWESVTPILRHVGFELAGDGLTRWLDDLFAEKRITSVPVLDHSLDVTGELAERLEALFVGGVPEPRILADSRSLWLLDTWASRFPQLKFLLFFTQAETALAHALRNDQDPESFLQDWYASNRVLLGFRRRYRDRALLFDAEAVCRQPQAFREACERIGLVLQPATQAPPLESALVLERLIARELLSEDELSPRVQAELEASAQPLEPSPIEPVELAPTALIDHYRQLQSLSAVNDVHKELLRENELLLLQLHQVQEELETVFLHKQTLEKTQRENAEQLQAQREESERLRQQLDEETRQSNEERQGLTQALEQQERAYATLEATKEELSQENELLLLQLHQVQEELEHYYLKYQELVEKTPQETSGQSRAVPDDTEANSAGEKIEQPRSGGGWRYRLLKSSAGADTPDRRYTRKRLEKEMLLLKGSGLFDEAWYLAEYGDVAQAGMDPVKHYLRYGAAEGRNPSPGFDTLFYLEANPDVADAQMNPLVHFIRFGQGEGRTPTRTKPLSH